MATRLDDPWRDLRRAPGWAATVGTALFAVMLVVNLWRSAAEDAPISGTALALWITGVVVMACAIPTGVTLLRTTYDRPREWRLCRITALIWILGAVTIGFIPTAA